MARILITGSADGLGQLAAKSLADQGHQVILHARNSERGRYAKRNVPGAEHAISGDLSNIDEIKDVAHDANALGRFDAVIYNAGVYQASPKEIFMVNTIAPYILTCLIQRPRRLIYLSSGMHLHGHANLGSFKKDRSRISYSDSKLHVVMLCMAVARKWLDVYSNAVDPGWVPTKMGGQGAPDNLQKGYETQTWLAVSDDSKAKVSGHYFHTSNRKPLQSAGQRRHAARGISEPLWRTHRRLFSRVDPVATMSWLGCHLCGGAGRRSTLIATC